MTDVKNLKNKPLVEAIFELRWALKGTPDSASDPAYDFLLGQLFALVKASFPVKHRLPAADAPENLTPFVPRIQFKRKKDGWPLLQLGPGILTVNETEGYNWEGFRTDCKFVVEKFFESCRSVGVDTKFFEITLRYIDADLLGESNALDYLKKLKVNVDLPKFFLSDSRVGKDEMSAGMSFGFPLVEPKGLIRVSFGQGQKGSERAIIWETQVLARGEDVPCSPDNIVEWIDTAHGVTHDCFISLIDGELLERYK